VPVVDASAAPVADAPAASACTAPAELALRLPAAAQALLAISRDPVLVVCHADHRILAANSAAERVYGRQAEALCRLRYDDLVTDTGGVQDIFRLHRHHVPLRYHRRADGSRFPVEMAIHWLPGDDAQGDGHRGETAWLRITDLSQSEAEERRLRGAVESYRAIFRNAPFPALLLDRRGLITDANEAALTLYRHSRISLMGQAMSHLLHDPRAARRYFSQHRWQALAERHRRGDGSEFQADVIVSSVSLSGEAHAIVVVRDVTDELALLARVQASEARWRFALEGHGDALWEWDLARGRFHVSRELSQQLAAVAAPLEHSPAHWATLVHSDDTARLRRAFLAHFKGDTDTVDVEIRLQARHAGYRWVWLRGKALERDAHNGRVLRLLGSVRDVHAQKQQAEELAQWREQVQHAARLSNMGEMAAALAHELNQPLTAIRTFSGAALRRLDDPALHDPAELRRAVQLIADEALRAGQVIRQIRSFLRKGPLRTGAVPPHELVASVVRLADLRAQRLGAVLEVAVPEALPALRADRVLVEQLLLNLVNNSLEAMRAQAGDRRVRIAVAQEDGPPGQLTLCVCDSGPGLPPAQVQQLYSPFVTTKDEGLGLGLAICHSIVDAHQGRIWAENPPEGGARVLVSLPVQTSAHEEPPHAPPKKPAPRKKR
jgi:PAS domain S-box-containing protein